MRSSWPHGRCGPRAALEALRGIVVSDWFPPAGRAVRAANLAVEQHGFSPWRLRFTSTRRGTESLAFGLSLAADLLRPSAEEA
jgi:hypothetical protein